MESTERQHRRWRPRVENAVENEIIQHHRKPWMQLKLERCSCATSLEKNFPNRQKRLSYFTIRNPLSRSGSHVTFWLFLLVLQQPRVGSGNLVARDAAQNSTEPSNVTWSPVNTLHFWHSRLPQAEPESRQDVQLISSSILSNQLLSHSDENFSQPNQSAYYNATYASYPGLTDSEMRGTSEGPLSFSSFSAFPPHSMDAQTTTKRTLTSVKMLEKRRRRHHRQPLWLQRHATSDGGGGFGYHDVVRLPSPRHVQLFIDYLNPYLKQSISPLQIQFIINQWHLFRQTVQQNRRMQRLQAAEREDAKRRMQNGRQGSKKVDLFAKVVLRREAQALKRAASFAEFKRILMRASAKPLQHAQSIRALESRADLTEVSGGAVFHPPLDLNATVADSKTPDHVLAKSEDTKKGISKRSVDASLLDEKETASEYQTTLQKPSSPSSREIPSEELYTDEETEEHSDDELREAYNSYNDFLSSACKPKNKTLCTRSLFVRSRVDRSTLFLPPGIYVKRCDNPVWSSVPGGGSVVNSYQAMFNQAARLRSRMALKSLCAAADRMDSVDGFADRLGAPDYYHSDVGGSCTCLLPEEECLPTKVRLKVASVIVYNTSKGSTSTEVIALTEHVSCGCQRRCENRRCIPPLQLNNYTYDDCYCSCPEGNTRCQALLDGRAKFTDKELQIPLNGSYILPPCYHGPMDEVHLYHRHCPRPDGRIGEFEPT